MSVTFETCEGCWLLTHNDSDGLCCAELGKTGDSLRCVIYYTDPLKSDKVVESVLQDIEFMEVL